MLLLSNSQIEIIYDEKTKEPKAILTTKNSDILKGVYEKPYTPFLIMMKITMF